MSGDPDREGVDATRLARAVRTTTEGAALGAAPHRERHRQTNWLRDVILGGQDGLVNILGIILGVIAGGGSNTVLVSVSQRDYYRAEREREETEVDTMPEAERREIRDIYAGKGFSGELLDQVVDTITANRERWVATMMDEELHLQPVERGDIFRSAIVITIATLIGHLIPLLPFLWLERTPALILAIVLSALVLFGVGVYTAVTLTGDWRKSGLTFLVIGLGAAGIGFLIGRLFHSAGA